MRYLLAVALVGLVLSGCDSNSNDANDLPRTFTVTVSDVSMDATITSSRANGTVPLSPPVYAVYMGSNPMFTVGAMANDATELIAEDGVPDLMAARLTADPNVSVSGVLTSPGGPDSGPAFFSGESASFTFVAEPGDRLQLETMFVQSNDWFYAFADEGLDLWDGDNPVDGDITSRLVLYDAGTEEDTAPGTGPTAPPGGVQKPVQDPAATDVGDAETVNITPAADRHSFTIPAATDVIQVTISSEAM